METKKCSQCKTDIAKDAKKCPQCHADLRSWFVRHYVLTSLGVLIILSIIFSSAGSKSPETSNSSAENNTGAVASKSYQQVFTFSGTGTKKSEPFNIQGDRFKIAYDCEGDLNATLCTAFVFKVGSSLPQGVMNSIKATKDETVIYTSALGKGDYYIDANVLGNFSMIVYDYK